MNPKLFMTEARFILKQGKTDAQSFWKALQQSQYEDNASFYCMQIFQNLTNPEKKQFVTEKQQKLFGTLLALQYYKDRKPKNQATIKVCKQYIRKNANYIQKWILELFISPHKDQQFVQDFMNHLAILPKDINWNGNIIQQIQDNLQEIRNSGEQKQLRSNQKERPSINSIKHCFHPQPVGIKMKEIGLAYICFMDCIRGNMNEMRTEQYEHMVTVFNALMNCAKVSDFWMNYLCVFMHFVTSCITFYSCTNQNCIRDLLSLANQMRNFWGPAGEIGNELFQILNKQLRIPGHAFRKKLRRDFPALDMKDSSFLNNQYYMVSESEDGFSSPQDRSLLNLRKLIIWHIMKISNLDEQVISQYIDMLRTMANDMTFHLYFKAMKIVDIAAQLQIYQKIKHVMKEKMKQLLKETSDRCKNERKKASQMEIQEFDSLIQDDNSLHIFRYPLYEIVYIPLNDFTNAKSKVNFLSIQAKNKREQSNMLFYQGSLSIIFYGTTQNFISVVQNLSKFLVEADVEECRQLKVFYLPKPQTSSKYDIGGYIASKDIWYNHFIYNIFKQQILYPPLEPSKKNKNLFPPYMMNKSLHMYLRQAKRTFNLNVYLCKLKLKDIDSVKEVYFTQSVMVGMFAEAEIIRMTKLKSQEKVAKYQNMNAIEIIKEKISKNTTATVDLFFQYIEPFSKKVVSRKQDLLRFDDLQICNMPRDNFFGSKPDPSGNSLKLSLLTEANAKIFLKEVKNSENFRQNKTADQILLAFKDIFINYSIKALQFKKRDENFFKVLVDGELYNKVEGFIISLPLTVNQLPISIPIQTFLPFK